MQDGVLKVFRQQYVTIGFNFLDQKVNLMLALLEFLVQRSMGFSPRKRFVAQKYFVGLYAMIISQ